MSFIFGLIANALFILQVLLIIYFITSFFPLNPSGFVAQIRGILAQLFEPIMRYLRKFVPSIGMFDLSGLVLIIGLQILQAVFAGLAR